MLTAVPTPLAGRDAQCVQVLGGHPRVDRVHVGASLCTCDMCAFTFLTRLGVQLCVGLSCLLQGCIAEFGLVWSGWHCFLRLSCVELVIVWNPVCCWALSAFSACLTPTTQDNSAARG